MAFIWAAVVASIAFPLHYTQLPWLLFPVLWFAAFLASGGRSFPRIFFRTALRDLRWSIYYTQITMGVSAFFIQVIFTSCGTEEWFNRETSTAEDNANISTFPFRSCKITIIIGPCIFNLQFLTACNRFWQTLRSTSSQMECEFQIWNLLSLHNSNPCGFAHRVIYREVSRTRIRFFIFLSLLSTISHKLTIITETLDYNAKYFMAMYSYWSSFSKFEEDLWTPSSRV